MNKYKLVMSALVLFSVLSAAAQQKSGPATQGPRVTKGYYAIGNNAQQLGATAPLPTKAVTQTGAEFNKGYHALGKNRGKLASQAGYIPAPAKRPTATKGYYSIGNNAGKLNK